MPINESVIELKLLALYNDLAKITDQSSVVRSKLAKAHAKIIVEAIKSADVIIDSGNGSGRLE